MKPTTAKQAETPGGERLPWVSGNAHVVKSPRGDTVLKSATKRWRNYGRRRRWVP